MSASPSTDERPIPSVAVVGNDAVLAAAPATPVQFAHACLRRGFTVAVPASWGDELVAAEVLRRLSRREKGPTVMCVCPYVRSRLLGSGPDLAPFLVSLVSPPVAVARYLRTVYGERGVRITYIGACPGGDDPAIDTCLTPGDFLADLADHGISLSEQPLVFDSIVPPDRRRWCSLPGGVPSTEMLWSETDTRTLVEIEPDDVATDLAQHIIAREHVLLDLAPSLGCACSGAIASLPARSARVAVTAAEPPRALGPVIDPSTNVTLDAPISATAPSATPNADTSIHALTTEPAAAREPEPPADGVGRAVFEVRLLEAAIDVTTEPSGLVGEVVASAVGETTETRAEGRETEPIDAAAGPTAGLTPAVAAPLEGPADPERVASPARRRTPPSVPVRHSASSIPRAIDGNGRPLPRAYVARRRTPPTGVVPVADGENTKAVPPAVAEHPPAEEPPTEVSAVLGESGDTIPESESAPAASPDAAPPIGPEDTAYELRVENPAPPLPPRHDVATSAVAAASSGSNSNASVEAAPEAPAVVPEPVAPPREPPPPPDAPARAEPGSPARGESARAPAATPASSHNALTILLVAALLTLAVVVLFTLRG